MKKRPLEVAIKNGELVIRIGVDTLSFAIENSPDSRFTVFDESTCDFKGCTVSDADIFAKEVLLELLSEAEDGTTVVHELLENAAFKAIENGANGITLPDEQPSAKAAEAAPLPDAPDT